MNFKATSSITFTGSSLITEVPGITMESVAARFPEGAYEAFYEPEKGYDSAQDVGFVDENGVKYHVYARYGVVRIGGFPDSYRHVRALVSFLLASCE